MFFSLFEFKRVGGVWGCSWTAYQQHFRADGRDLHLIKRNDEGSRCSATGKIRWLCPCGKQEQGPRRSAAAAGARSPGDPERTATWAASRAKKKGKPPCGGGIARRQLQRLLDEAFSKV